jgi:hypothetical protein
MKNVAQTVDAEPVESGSYLATSRNPLLIKNQTKVMLRIGPVGWFFFSCQRVVIFPGIEDADFVRCANMDNFVLANW